MMSGRARRTQYTDEEEITRGQDDDLIKDDVLLRVELAQLLMWRRPWEN